MTRTIEIDIELPGLRVKRSTGVTERRTADAMKAMLRVLWGQPAGQRLVRAVIHNRRTLADLYLSYREGKLDALGASPDDRLLYDARETWLSTTHYSASHHQRLKQVFRKIEALARKPRLGEAPELLLVYLERCVKAGTPRAFNYAKMGVQALLKSLLGRRHPLYERVNDIQKMTEAKDGPQGKSVADAIAIRDKLPEKAARIWWAMCLTGMGPTEYWGQWTVLGDRVRIRGTKRPGRRWGVAGRDVPLIVTPLRPEISYKRFGIHMRDAGAVPVQGRKCFARWLEEAGVSRTRRKLYLGHSAKDVTDLYERHEISAYVSEDAARLRPSHANTPQPIAGRGRLKQA